jgi:tetratricopeptide (TPR) repeat protein
MDREVRQRRTLEAIKRILLRESLNQPLIVVFEDLHCVDSETRTLLDLLVDSIAGVRVLLLVNYRPQYRHDWSNKNHFMRLRLDPLGRESAEEMLSALLGDGAALEPLRRLIIANTEGNPFYMEETVQVLLLDDDSLIRNGVTKFTKPLAELKIPPTVQAILASSIDHLPAEEKDLLQTLAVDQLDDYLPDLARHYSRSGNTEKAIHYLRMAGEQAARRCAHEEAIALFNSALEMVPRVPEDQLRMRHEVELRLALVGSLVANHGYAAPEVAESAQRALELSHQIGEPEAHFSALMFAWSFHQVSRDLQRASETSRELIELAERAREPAMIAHANFASGAVSVFRGKFQNARASLEQAVAVSDPPPLPGTSQDSRVAALSFLALTMWLLGYPAAAVDIADEAGGRARSLGHPMSLAFALSYGAMLHLCRRDPNNAHELADQARRVAIEHGFDYWSALGSTYCGLARAGLGQTDEGIAETLAGIESYRATGSALGGAAVVIGLVSSYLKAGQSDEALRAAEQALGAIEQSTARMSQAELYRLKGEALLDAGPQFEAQARDSFEKAITIAREQEARSWELRATTSLARLLRDTGRRNEARTILTEIYDWFTEGFDTADLIDAKSLLDELNT